MRAKKTRAARKSANESATRPRTLSRGKADHSDRNPPILNSASGPPQRGGLNAFRSLEDSVSRHADIASWSEASLAALVSHITNEHHRFTYRQLTRLERLLAQVVDQHARDLPQLVEFQVLFLVLSDKLTAHMIREEQMLFAYVLRLEEALEHGERLARPVFGSVREPIDVLMVEHEGMKTSLDNIQAAARRFGVALAGSGSWKALARGLKALEKGLRHHFQLEDTVLFPRTVSAESSDRCLVDV